MEYVASVRVFAFGLCLLAPVAAFAGGFEIVEQSPAGVALAGAMTGRADDPSAMFYNPAGLTKQRGLGFLGGGGGWAYDGHVNSPGGGPTTNSSGATGLPMVYLTQRLGPYVGIGFGAFTQFASHVEYPQAWPGALAGTRFHLTTTTINLAASVRPLPQLSIGVGVVLVPGSLSYAHDLGTPGAGGLRADMSGLGFGAVVGVLVQAVPKRLRIGATYRSVVDIDLTGIGSIDQPGMPSQPLTATSLFSTPHNLALGLSSEVTDSLTLSVDARWTMWTQSQKDIATTLYPPGTMPTVSSPRDTLDTNLRDAIAVRLGVEYRLLQGALPLRAGLGVDTTPVRQGWLAPLQPDNLRVIVGFGAGYQMESVGIDLGYSVQILTDRTSTSPLFPQASYGGLVHIAALALTIRLPDFGGRLNVPEYKY
jgi:long-chain fatty acid transport protein